MELFPVLIPHTQCTILCLWGIIISMYFTDVVFGEWSWHVFPLGFLLVSWNDCPGIFPSSFRSFLHRYSGGCGSHRLCLLLFWEEVCEFYSNSTITVVTYSHPVLLSGCIHWDVYIYMYLGMSVLFYEVGEEMNACTVLRNVWSAMLGLGLEPSWLLQV